jgi:biopolymer transport protein ExbB
VSVVRVAALGFALVGMLSMAPDAVGQAPGDSAATTQKSRLAERDRLKAQVAAARTRLDAARARKDELLRALEARHPEVSGVLALGEVLGVVRHFATEAYKEYASQSLTGAKFPERPDILARLSELATVPEAEAEDLEILSTDLLREAAECGRVDRFTTEIATAAGGKERTEVVRIGAFVALAGDRYLAYDPERRLLAELPQQPPRELREAGRAVGAASAGYTRALIDPSLGEILSAYAEGVMDELRARDPRSK